MKEVTEENKCKLISYSQRLFEDMQSDPEYHFTTWEQQFDECYKLFTSGDMSQRFLDFAAPSEQS